MNNRFDVTEIEILENGQKLLAKVEALLQLIIILLLRLINLNLINKKFSKS